MAASAVLSVVGAVLFSGWLSRTGPVRAVPVVLAASGCTLVVEWVLLEPSPRVAAALLYLHVTALGPLLLSGFWSVVNERFDPHTAKRAVSQMAAAGALAGVASGVAAERIASLAGIGWTLALLILLAVGAAVAVRCVGGPEEASAAPSDDAGGAMAIVVRHPLLGPMALLMVLGAAIDTFLDYVLKLEAAAIWPETDELVRFFAAFYVACGLLAFVFQGALGSRVLQRFGLGGAMAVLPLVVIATGGIALSAWRIGTVVLVRGMQSVMEGGLFRSAFELLYTPLPATVKRPIKAWIDVAARSVGSIAAAGLVLFLLFVSPDGGAGAVVALSMATAGLMLWMILRAQRSYVDQLGDSLRSGGVRLAPEEVEDATTAQTVAQGHTAVDRRALLEQVHAYAEEQKAAEQTAKRETAAGSSAGAPVEETEAQAGPALPDPVLARVIDVCSGDPARVRRALHARDAGVRSVAGDRRLVPHVVPLLAVPALSRDAEGFLRRTAPRSLGQLIDSLLDRNEPLEVRLALTRILPNVQERRALEGLWLVLDDPSFELRRASAEAAVRLVEPQPSQSSTQQPSKAPPRDVVHARVEQELMRGDDVPPARRLEQVFALLALLHGRETMRSTHSGVLSESARQRGTALELLETVLPPTLVRRLFELIDGARG
jgi:hypothetical protein